MKFTTTAMKNGVLALLLMSSAASAQEEVIKPAKGVSIEELAAKYQDFRILAKPESLDNDPQSNKADEDEWILKKVLFFRGRMCGPASLIIADNSFISSDNDSNVGALFDNEDDGDVNISITGKRLNYWVGYSAAAPKSLGCVRVKQRAKNFMTSFKVQVLGDDGSYKTLYTISGITSTGTATFNLLDSWPSEGPSISPSTSLAPSLSPSQTPSISGIPSVLPSQTPSISAISSVLPSQTPSVSGNPSDSPSVSQIPSVSSAPSCSPSTSPSPTKSSKSSKGYGCGSKKSAKSASGRIKSTKEGAASDLIPASLSSQISGAYDSFVATSVTTFVVLAAVYLV